MLFCYKNWEEIVFDLLVSKISVYNISTIRTSISSIFGSFLRQRYLWEKMEFTEKKDFRTN